MFHSLAGNYKMLSSNNQCIYSQYKIYVEKYHRLKEIVKSLRFQNKTMEKELKVLKKELQMDYCTADRCKNDEIIIQVNDNYLVEIDDYVVEKDELDVDDKYELV